MFVANVTCFKHTDLDILSRHRSVLGNEHERFSTVLKIGLPLSQPFPNTSEPGLPLALAKHALCWLAPWPEAIGQSEHNQHGTSN